MVADVDLPIEYGSLTEEATRWLLDYRFETGHFAIVLPPNVYAFDEIAREAVRAGGVASKFMSSVRFAGATFHFFHEATATMRLRGVVLDGAWCWAPYRWRNRELVDMLRTRVHRGVVR